MYSRELEIAICYANNALASGIMTDARVYIHFSVPLFAHLHKVSTKNKRARQTHHHLTELQLFASIHCCPSHAKYTITHTLAHSEVRQREE